MTLALAKVDQSRREKVLKQRTARARAASVGAGLLLQKAVRDWQTRRQADSAPEGVGKLTLPALLDELPEPFPLTYRYGEMGKPYFRDIPLYFSISHSGDYVLCAVSEWEIGADIQQRKLSGWKESMCDGGISRKQQILKLARRFFAEVEYSALESARNEAEREALFFECWTKKEAYGKLTGQGVAGVLNRAVCFSPDNWGSEKSSGSSPDGETVPACGKHRKEPHVEWMALSVPEDYAAAVCVERQE